MTWQPLETSKADAEQGYVLTATVIEAGASTDTLDLQFDGALGRIDNVPVHYHCQGEEDTAYGGEAFEEDDVVNVFHQPSAGAPSASSLTVIGFADGLPHYCPTQYAYIKLSNHVIVWDVRRAQYADIDGISSWPVLYTNAALTTWLTSHPELASQTIWNVNTLTDQDTTDYMFPTPPCVETNTGGLYDPPCVYEPVHHNIHTMSCAMASACFKGGTHTKSHINDQFEDNCGYVYEITNQTTNHRPAVESAIVGRYPRAVNLTHPADEDIHGWYATESHYEASGYSPDGGVTWEVAQATTLSWDSHLGHLLGTSGALEEADIWSLTAEHDIVSRYVPRTTLPTGPCAAVDIQAVRLPGPNQCGVVACARMVDPATYNFGSMRRQFAFSNAVEDLCQIYVDSTYNISIQIRR